MNHVYFVTGFPGFISNQLLRQLIDTDSSFKKTYFLVLPSQKEAASKEIQSVIEEKKLSKEQFEIIAGDITYESLGMTPDVVERLREEVSHVFHLAAIYDLAVPRDIAYRVNVMGTRNVNQWVKQLYNLKRYVYFSTGYVAGTREGILKEEELIRPDSFKNHYEETKYEAEVLVDELKSVLPITIIRPGIVKGHSETGKTIKFDGPYFILNFLHAFRSLPVIPYLGSSSGAVVNLVPVDFIIKATAFLSLSDKGRGKTYHLTDPNPYTVTEIYSFLVGAYLKKKPAGKLPLGVCKAALALKPVRKLLGVEKEALDYFTWKGRFDCTQAQKDLEGSGIICPDLRDGIGTMVSFYSQNRHNKHYQITIK